MVAAVLMLAAGCSGDPGTGPVEVRWDRDICERCRMVLSARQHSAQIRVKQAEGRSRIYKFDDIGCAVLWLEQQPWRDNTPTEIWVNDHRNGEWIDARKAYYVTGQLTPMEYGLGAQADPVEGALDFEEARRHIHEVEAKYNVHGTHLEQHER